MVATQTSVGQRIIEEALRLEKIRGSNLEREEYAAIIAQISGIAVEKALAAVDQAIASFKAGQPWTAWHYDQWHQTETGSGGLGGGGPDEPPPRQPTPAQPTPTYSAATTRLVNELERTAASLGRALTEAEYAQVLRSVGFSPAAAADLARQALAGNWGAAQWENWYTQNTRTIDAPTRPTPTRGVTLVDPWKVNPAVWDSLGPIGQGLTRSAAQEEGWDPDEYVRQINLTRPTGSAPNPSRVRFAWDWPGMAQDRGRR